MSDGQSSSAQLSTPEFTGRGRVGKIGQYREKHQFCKGFFAEIHQNGAMKAQAMADSVESNVNTEIYGPGGP